MDPNLNNNPRPNRQAVSEPVLGANSPPAQPSPQQTPTPIGQPAPIPPPAPQQVYPYGPPPRQPLTESTFPEDLPPTPPRKKQRRGLRSAFSTLLLFLMAPVIAIFIAAFGFQSYQVEGASMEKTLQNHDRLIVNKLSRSWAKVTGGDYTPSRGDIIIFNQTGLPQSTFLQDKQLIKRVVALPGERIVIKDGQITVFNQEHPQGFNPDIETGYIISSPSTPGNLDIVVPEGEIFVCGDNRHNSEDSRFFGPIKLESIVGKLALRILPLDKAQNF